MIRAMRILASKPGIYGMIGGQVADVELEGTPLTIEQILFIHKNKTSALIEACMMIGAVLAGAEEEESNQDGAVRRSHRAGFSDSG